MGWWMSAMELAMVDGSAHGMPTKWPKALRGVGDSDRGPGNQRRSIVAANAKPHVLFVFYSFTQQTRRVADTMAGQLRGRGYDVTEAPIEFSDDYYGKRFSKRPMDWPIAKIFAMLPAQARKKSGTVGIPTEASEGAYDLVVIGSPTWWLTACMPVRSYLHDPAAQRVLGGTPFAVFSTSRRYYKGTIKTIRTLGEKVGGTFVDSTHFVAYGNQVTSMWSWLAFMRHDKVKERSLGYRLPKPNLRDGFEEQANGFINGVADKVLAPGPSAGQ
jgi:flavodoxin